eukprot:CAMPEP_0172564744 /NCGR_PEP_ID=MMETSP1067-20121228/105609_1 /TAXON_ID=265564 ORGANISM="Thalassiosira punctigera, Strain Tpunct2005C2" /NCGR_SAMPLE_ID=MMETSP1067 /ASSEMBLY_ACC=CAM_ASM_000444 /LENGTH=283 /DNA_ID=CAMNT_0013355491 /DNA_START=38 /DNA_END=886 /DNA_ORIENTATION=-
MDEPLLPPPTAPPKEDVVVEEPQQEPQQEPQEEPKKEPPMEPQKEPQKDPQQEPRQPQHRYPDPFYCPLTQKVMKDPVVGADGDSFENSAVLERDAAESSLQSQQTYYPNRALKKIIDKEKQRIKEQGTMVGALHRAEESVRSGFKQILEKSALPSADYRPLPDAYYCPITFDIISRPAIDPDGNTYERQAIIGWIRINGTSPLTRNALTVEQLRDNNALDDLINAEANKGEGSVHPSIRRLVERRNEAVDEESSRPDAPGEGESSPYPTSQEEIDERSRSNW